MVGKLSGESLPNDVQATFCATLVDEWIRYGIGHAVVAPGSRSTPMAVALADRPEIEIHVVHDERVAGFVALGLGLDGIPALLLCTSGTAAANFLPAVVEAGLSEVPMVVLTADRPPELRGVGAPQTIDQIELYGRHVRWFHDAEVAHVAAANTWRELAQRAAVSARNGPIQLNLGFREPLLGAVHELPATSGQRTVSVPAVEAFDIVGLGDIAMPRGVILAGGRSGVPAQSVADLHAVTGWPIIADPVSGLRHLKGAVTAAESLLRHDPFARAHAPDVVVRIGRPASSKTLAQWVDRAVSAGATLLQVGGPGRIDPGHNVQSRCSIDAVLERCRPVEPDIDWSAHWAEAESTAHATIESTLADLAAAGELSEPGVARAVADSLPENLELVVSSSMPVRDHEWFGGKAARAHVNRGANGIDGVISTALGRALALGGAALLIGDLAFVHDSSALAGLRARDTDLRIVVVDNNGGGIFSFLPQAAELTSARFEQLFGTPHDTDVLALAAAHGVETVEVESIGQLGEQLGRRGPWVARIGSDRQRNVEIHARLHAAVADSLG